MSLTKEIPNAILNNLAEKYDFISPDDKTTAE